MCFGGGGSKDKKPKAPSPPEVGYQTWMNEGFKARGETDPGNSYWQLAPGAPLGSDLGNAAPAPATPTP